MSNIGVLLLLAMEGNPKNLATPFPQERRVARECYHSQLASTLP